MYLDHLGRELQYINSIAFVWQYISDGNPMTVIV